MKVGTMADRSTSKRANLDWTRPTRILARSMYKKLVSEGYDERQIVAFATEIIARLTVRFRGRHGSQGAAYKDDAADAADPAVVAAPAPEPKAGVEGDARRKGWKRAL